MFKIIVNSTKWVFETITLWIVGKYK